MLTCSYKKQLAVCLLVGLLLTLFGCTASGDTNTPDSPTTTTTTFSPLEGIDLSRALTVAQVAEGLGLSAEELSPVEIYENGTALRFATHDWQTFLDVTLQPLSAEMKELALSSCEEYTPAPHLGEAAWFDEESEWLLVFFGNYQLSVRVESEAVTANRLILTRHFAALVLEGLS